MKEKKELIEQLEKVKKRVQILDMMEARLLKMKEIAMAMENDKIDMEKRKEIEEEFNALKEQLRLLDTHCSKFS